MISLKWDLSVFWCPKVKDKFINSEHFSEISPDTSFSSLFTQKAFFYVSKGWPAILVIK